MKVERVRCVKFFDSPEFEDTGKNGQVEDEIDTIPQVTPRIEQQNATDNDEKPATPPVGDVARYPTRIRNKLIYLDEYVVDSTTNLAVDYCYRMNDIPTCYSQAVTHQIPLAGKGQWMRKLTL